ATGAIAGAMLALHLQLRWKVAVGIALAFVLNAVVLAGSRGAFLGLLAGGMALAIFRPAQYKRQFLVYGATGILMLGVLGSSQFWDRMKSVQAITADDPEEMDDSARSRLVMASAQLQMAALHPLGAGHRGSEVLS